MVHYDGTTTPQLKTRRSARQQRPSREHSGSGASSDDRSVMSERSRSSQAVVVVVIVVVRVQVKINKKVVADLIFMSLQEQHQQFIIKTGT